MFVLNNSLNLVKNLSSDMLRLLSSSHIWQRKREKPILTERADERLIEHLLIFKGLI